MIGVDFNLEIVLYIVSQIVIVLFFWLSEEFNFRRIWQFKEKIWQCCICTHVYRASYDLSVTQCPLCLSYNKYQNP